MPSTAFPKTRARLAQLGYPAPLADALLGLAATLDGERLRRRPARGPRPPDSAGGSAARTTRRSRRLTP